jgi:hypothetical protein
MKIKTKEDRFKDTVDASTKTTTKVEAKPKVVAKKENEQKETTKIATIYETTMVEATQKEANDVGDKVVEEEQHNKYEVKIKTTMHLRWTLISWRYQLEIPIVKPNLASWI